MRGTTALLAILLLVVAPVALAAPAAGQSAQNVTITVAVTDPGGNPIADVELTASWDGGQTIAKTVSNGKAFMDVPEGATVEITASHASYTRNHPFVVESAEEEEVSVTVYRKASATVTVVDSERTVPNAQVRFWKNGRVATGGTTNQDGVIESGIIEAGEYTITVVKPGYKRSRTTVDITNQVEEKIEIETGFVTVEFRVVDDHFNPPKPVQGAVVQVGDIGSVNTQSNGLQRLTVPVNDRYEVTVSKEGYRTITRNIDVGEEEMRINYSIRRTPSLSVTLANEKVVVGERLRVDVVGEYGDPVANAEVYIDGERAGTTNEQGVAMVPVESAGAHDVEVRKEGLTSKTHSIEGIAQQEETPTPTPEPESTPTERELPLPPGMPGFGFDVAGLAVALVVGALFLRQLRG